MRSPLATPPAMPPRKSREILLADRGERGIIHALHFDAPFVAVVAAGIEEFLLQVGWVQAAIRLAGTDCC